MKHYQIRRRLSAQDVVLEEFDDRDGRPEIIDTAKTADELLNRWSFGPRWQPLTAEERASRPLLANVLYES